MFTDSLTELARRKEQLIARAEQQRRVISVSCLQLQKPLAMVDRGIAAVRYLRAHPLLLAAGVLAAAAIGRRNLLGLGRPRLVHMARFALGAAVAAQIRRLKKTRFRP